ncbi:MAG: cytochrome P450 [Thermoleophilaceae bacterium]|nr:cytochrome P450 [Thermoleophilaceae bacterium]
MSTTIDTDISARTFWEKPFVERDKTFAHLRENDPVSYHRPYESTLLPPDEDTPGFYSLVKYDDIRMVSRDSKRFISRKGILMEDFPEIVQVATTSFLAMDGEDHKRQRGIVSTAFTPRNVKKIEDWIDEHAREIVDEMIDRGEGDFCTLVAKELPGRIFAHFFGAEVGSEDQEILMDAAEKMLAWDDPNAAQGRDALETFGDEAQRIQDIALKAADDRRENPQDDLVSWVVNAEFEGERLDDWEVAAFFSLLGSAANDTTRHSLGHAMLLFDEHPDQLELLRSDFDGHAEAAVNEVLRHASPVMQFRRTAVEDCEIRGTEIKAGEKLVMWYCSGNRDDEQFPDPARFDITRGDNKHLAFGGGGAHYCIGATLGKQMLKSAMKEVYTRIPDIHVTGPPELQLNNFIHGVHSLPVAWTPQSGSR